MTWTVDTLRELQNELLSKDSELYVVSRSKINHLITTHIELLLKFERIKDYCWSRELKDIEWL